MKYNYRHVLLAILALTATAPSAFAEGFDIRQFSPAPGPESVFSVESSQTLRHLGYDIKLMTDYANTPLAFSYEDGQARLEHLVSMHLSAAIGLLDFLEVGLVLPFVAYEGYNDVYKSVIHLGVPQAKSGVFGDMQLRVKASILKRENYHGFGLGAGLILTMPTGKPEALIGTPSVTGRPYVILDYEIGPVELMLNAGFTFRKTREFLDYTRTHTFDYGFGVVYHAVEDWLDVKGEIFAATPLSRVATNDHQNSAEWLLGARLMTPVDFDITAGVGTGIGDGVGNPKVRVLLGLEYAPRFSDADADGIDDRKDFCPNLPGTQAFEGCPNPDADADSWCDPWIEAQDVAEHFGCKLTDACPDDPGEDDFEGCPNPDTDTDGWCDPWITDADMALSFACKQTDACPDVSGEDDFEGCPNHDSDNDGWCDPWITDADMAMKFNCQMTDVCPNHAGDAENSGCPNPDVDSDGMCAPFVEELSLYDNFFCSGNDMCPDSPEDFDDFEDEDGCPDPDNDHDGICDPWVSDMGLLETYASVCKGLDKCPMEPETINGVKDDDGCPDSGKQLVFVLEDKIEIKDKIYFNNNKATIQKKSNSLLDQLAQTIMANPSIKKVSVEGHTDDTGKYEHNLTLSRQRAQAVVDALVKRGVSADRLSAIGHGPDKPLDPAKTKAARALNRRVEFLITERK